ncbi:MAG: right-handed parallel beta-helix repeat-containing protein [Armatimonadota bacterium]|jgi:hypothetical protein
MTLPRCLALILLLALLLWAGVTVAASRRDAASFYVDPDWHGPRTGAAETPWTHLDQSAWLNINDALAAADVTVYFSAREADADTDETTTENISILRTDTSTNRITLDGMSRYNTSDAAPAWADYSGRAKFHITHDYPINTATRDTKRSHVTIRGFKVIAGSGRRGGQGVAYWGGDHVVIEHCEITHHDDVAHGPGIIFGYAWNADGTPKNAGCTDITVRNNVVHTTYGEGIYIGGSHDVAKPAHTNVTIENNTIYDVAVHGAEGDAIDVKDASSNVVIRGNTCYMTQPGAGRDGIVCGSGCLVEGNFIYNFGRSGISLGTYWNAHPARDGSVVRNNIIAGTGGNTRYSWDHGIIVSGDDSGDQFTNIGIYNNTICSVRGDEKSSAVGLVVTQYATGARVKNNIVSRSAGISFSPGEGALAEHDHNLYYSPDPDALLVRSGRHRYTAATLTQFEPNSLTTDPRFINPTPPYAAAGFKLQPDSPAIAAGVSIDSFAADFFGLARGATWDIGAAQHDR